MKVLVTGAAGQVGTALRNAKLAPGETLVALARADLSLLSWGATRDAFDRERPDVVINAAAYTDVERAESEELLARAANAIGPANLASVAESHGAAIVHISTDFVFDGGKGAPYVESDTPSPQGAYARTKREGEEAVAGLNPRHAIVRTAWVYSPAGRNFVKTMLKLAADRDEVRVVDDQRGNPTSAYDLAEALLAVARRTHAEPSNADLQGLLHLAAPDDATWADFAEAIFAESARRGGPFARVVRVSTTEYGSRVVRPADSRLDCSRAARVYGIALPSWRDSLPACIDRIIGGRARRDGDVT